MSQLSLLPESATSGDGILRAAVISECGMHRYLLTRRWAPGPTDLWVMLNPSMADGRQDDPTLRRIVAFSRGWGAGSLAVVNLASLRSSHPDALYDETVAPIGPEANRYIAEAAERTATSGGRILAGWGSAVRFDDFAPFFLRGRDQKVLRTLTSFGDVYCLGKTAAGAPVHPLARGRSRVPDDAEPRLFAAREGACT